ncbi:MAG: hypothetical protein JXR48_05260 [Candidatus Delongbacteria bacterium]|nr:hypothetical protein [Candidatus Delongbacteria bacterium]MBN2834357.1 hypothetical protein [Candidatus Delongbacteria bacterium]
MTKRKRVQKSAVSKNDIKTADKTMIKVAGGLLIVLVVFLIAGKFL